MTTKQASDRPHNNDTCDINDPALDKDAVNVDTKQTATVDTRDLEETRAPAESADSAERDVFARDEGGVEFRGVSW